MLNILSFMYIKISNSTLLLFIACLSAFTFSFFSFIKEYLHYFGMVILAILLFMLSYRKYRILYNLNGQDKKIKVRKKEKEDAKKIIRIYKKNLQT